MNKCLFIVLASLSAPSFAAMPVNFYDCQGANASASYVTESRAGTILTMTVNGVTYQVKNDSILDQPTVLGHLLTLTTETIPDLQTDTLTLLLPDVNVSNFGDTAKFATLLFKTRTLSSIGGPTLVEGVIQNNKAIPLKCTATAAVF
jgi:hypothetical protein